jgi:hypothetical protein
MYLEVFANLTTNANQDFLYILKNRIAGIIPISIVHVIIFE